ncbi:GumC family protein [Geomonas anaerohicana]|uniref:GumC family protein n=1 Tax=Geomonas anaerohicana TaxID=2798583 RepID=A0ABS0YH80_9BACT|nr:GumC family protein [Geomonas anaerohicana]MBJ6751626.1 GumC family protein [Geomonas anaerohicana]
MEMDSRQVLVNTKTAVRYVGLVFKNKRILVTSFIVVFMLAVFVALLIQPLYEAKSTVLIKMGREYLARPEIGERIAAPTMAINQDGLISSELQILSSKELRDKVVKEISAFKLYPDLITMTDVNIEDLAETRLERTLKLNKVKNSNVIEIAYEHADPEIAAKVVNSFVDYFRDKHLQVFREPQSTFLQQQLEMYTEKLRTSEQDLEAFKSENDVYSLGEQRTLLLQQKQELDAALKSNDNQIRELQKKVAVLKSQLHTVYKSRDSYVPPERSLDIQDAKAKLLGLLLEDQRLSKKYTPSSKLIINSKNEIEIVKNYINELEADANNKAKTGNQVYLDLYKDFLASSATLQASVAKGTSVRAQLQEIKNSLASINRGEQRLESLKREKAMNEKNYQNYLDRVEESRMLEEMNRQKLANISVIQTAAVPVVPSTSSRLKIIALGFVSGIFVAIGAVLLKEKSDQTFSTPEKVELVSGLPVFVSIPYN